MKLSVRCPLLLFLLLFVSQVWGVDFTLNAPGTTNNPWTPASVLTPVGTTFGIKSDATGYRSVAVGDFSEYAHNVSYTHTITVTVTVAAGATSNGDEIWTGAVVRTGGNASAGIGCIWGAFSVITASWTGLGGLGGSTAISAGVSITRANADVLSTTVTIVGTTATITCKQNSTSITFSANTTTNFTTEASLAAGAAFNAQNSNSLYASQFTGTGVTAGNTSARTLLVLGVGN